ncbi:immunity 53 family protein [Embleya sp. NPDC020630]|uniref:immunity 53 family protein n=1 Tax=Embleya sp. NPDC020630 TaxID=3363979 RepID=UPI0037B6D022
MTDSRDLLDWLRNWYARRCDGDWEHERGVRIATLDNPGWTIEIDLAETDPEGHPYPLRIIDRGPQDWVRAHTADGRFNIDCGPRNLVEALTLFRDRANTTPS